MKEDDTDEHTLYANCTYCGTAIRSGDLVVTVARYQEEVQVDGTIEVVGEDTLASLCSSCGQRFPASAMRLDLGGRSFIGACYPHS